MFFLLSSEDAVKNVFAQNSFDLDRFLFNEKIDDTKNKTIDILLNNITLRVDVAITDLQKQKGLSIKNTLKEDEGMIFIFEKPKQAGFWMKGMKFPIDIIWLNNNLSIIHIEKELQPCPTILNCPVYKPDKDALYVLETVSGFSDKYDLKENDTIQFITQ
ncbi:MAG: DUF192 domain-containing protein [Nitrososphaeraceae archaeon]